MGELFYMVICVIFHIDELGVLSLAGLEGFDDRLLQIPPGYIAWTTNFVI